jgi:hypothetical protein
VMTFIGHAGENSLVLEAREPKAHRTRWMFTDIRPDGFHWRNEDETEDGTIIVRQTFEAVRSAVRRDDGGGQSQQLIP